MNKPSSRLTLALVATASLLSLSTLSTRGEYGYFYTSSGGSLSGSDIITKELRWPYWNSYYYNTWINDDWTSSDGVSGYFYNGLALPAAGSPNPVGTQQTFNFSFWPLSNPINITDTIGSVYTSSSTFSMPTIGEGTLFRSPGKWSLWQTNVWYRMAIRTWQSASGAAHQGYAGTWLRDPVAGVWYHMATVQLPFAVTGLTGCDSFQENASGGSQPQRTDYRRCYYHRSGVWSPATEFQVYDHGGGNENVGLIETNTAVYYETCENNASYVGTITSSNATSAIFTLTQPATPPLDPIVVTNYGATMTNTQLLVQWQVPATSSPQFAYQINVYTNASYTGTVVASSFDYAPETRQKMLTTPAGITPYPQLTIIDVFNQTNAPVSLTVTNAILLSSTTVSGAMSGLNFAYYQSATGYTSDSYTNWSAMPNFALLTPVSSGAVSGLDLTPRQRRNGYAFNYTGYLNVPSNGLYAFTLNSCDGSKLYLDGQLVINWDGDHSSADQVSWLGLQAGYHTLNVQYFFDVQPTSLFSDYFDTLTLSWEGPGITKTVVPVTAFYRVPGGSEPSVSLASPTNGATLSDASVPLSATVTASGNAVNKVQFYVGNNYWAQDATAPYSVNSFFWANANNAVRARLNYNGTNQIDSAVNLVTTTNVTVAPWQYGQIFYHNLPSGASIANGTYSMIGDGVNLMTRQVSGNCTLIARLAGITSSAAAPDGSTANTGWQAGIILRGTTNMTPGYPWGQSGSAPFVAVFGQVDGGTYYQDELMVNGGGGYSRSVAADKWFKLVRTSGTNFTSFVSADGVTWIQVGNTNLTDFGTTLYAGFFTFAGPSSNPNVHRASFDNVSIAGNIVGPPGVTVSPQTDTVYAGQNLTLTAMPTGNAPFAYQWQLDNVNLAGATNATLSLTNLQPTASGLYTVQLSNSNGTAMATATLTVQTPSAPVAAVLSNNPVAYWRLNETAGPTAYDAMGNFSGTGEGGIVFGVPGVTNSPFTGFEANNLAAQFDGTDADINVPAMNLNTNAVTITGWLNLNGAQNTWSGIVFCRSGTTTSGMNFAGTTDELGYTWNNSSSTYNWPSGLIAPTNQWTFVALAISPTQAVMYMATNGTLHAATNAVANAVQAFAGSTYLGYDPNSNARRFNGAMDEVAIYNQTLTAAQIGQILSASLAATPPGVSLTAPANGAGFAAPATLNLAASVATNGHSITGVQFYSGSTLLGQSTTAPYSFVWNNVPAGTYTVFAQVTYDAGGTQSSAPAVVTVNLLPSAPVTITPVALSGNLISIAWPAGTNATGYLLSRNGSAIASLAGTNYLDLGLSPSTQYAYSVVATSAYGSSSPSVTNSATTLGTGTARWWDAGGSTTGPQDGSGNWGGSANTWWNGSANVTWADTSPVIFGNGASTNCSVLLTNNVTPGNLIFNANNGGTYSLSSSGGSLLILSGTPTITCNDSENLSATLNGGGFIKTGPGTLTITGGNTNTGAITVNGGRLVATSGGWYANRGIGSGSLTVNSGAVAEFSVAHGFGYGSGGEPATLNGGTLQFDHENYVNSLTMTAGTVSGAGEIRTTGGTYSTLASANSSVISLNINFVSAGTFSVARGTGAVDLLASGPASDTGNFTKSGSGIMAISGAWANTGATTVSAGTLQVDGSLGTNTVTVANNAILTGVGVINGVTTVANGGTLAPGDASPAGPMIGMLSFNTNLTLSSSSKTLLKVSKNGGVLANDHLVVTGALGFGGSLTVTNTGTNAFAVGDSFQLFSFASHSGGFGSLMLPALATNLVWSTGNLTNNGTLVVVSLPQISSPPQSVTIYVNSNAAFSVTAGGTPSPAYQWQFNGTNLAGASATNLIVTAAQTNNEGNYTVVLTNVAGSLTSSVANLSLYRNFGCAPSPYPSLLVSNGARHLIVPGFQLGATNPASTDARTNTVSEGGMVFATALQAGRPVVLQVVASAAGYLSGWIDYNTNGSWADAGEQVFTNLALSAGTNILTLGVPAAAAATTNTWARFRFSSATNLTFTGQAPDGEVEDFSLAILVSALTTLPPAILPGLSFSGDSGLSLTATGAVGGTCVLLGATNLTSPIVWQPLQTNTADTNGVYNFSDAQATNFWQRYYRLLAQ